MVRVQPNFGVFSFSPLLENEPRASTSSLTYPLGCFIFSFDDSVFLNCSAGLETDSTSQLVKP